MALSTSSFATGGELTVKLTTVSATGLSGGSPASASVICAAMTVSVQAVADQFVVGVSVKLVDGEALRL